MNCMELCLTTLDISNGYGANNPNRLTEKIIPVLTECLQNNLTLIELKIPKNLQSSTTSIKKAVNGVRNRNGLPCIEVKGIILISVPIIVSRCKFP